MRTLNQILIDINAVVDLDASLPEGDEQTLRTNYVNQSVWDAAAIGQLQEFKQEYITNSPAEGLATIPLPSNFREFMVDPIALDSNGSVFEYPEIFLEEKRDKSSGERYCYVLGNPAEGYNMVMNAVATGATVSVILQRYPSGMATLTDKCELPDPTYATKRAESYVLYSRGDDRFQVSESRAESVLANMMSRELKTPGGLPRRTKTRFKNPLR